MRRAAWAMVLGAGAQTSYLLTLLVAGRRATAPPPAGGALPDLVVLVPAHDEQLLIAGTVRALLAAGYPGARREVVVIADNCADATADVARQTGATVWERDEPDRRGKGQALAWAIERIRRERPDADAVAVVDADCEAGENVLRALGARVAAGADAVQADYRVSNPGASPTAALRYAGFALFNSVRTRGKERLGLSSGLLGTGMAFPLRTLDAVPWDAFSVAEDREYHARLVASGRRARFAAEATVDTAAPESETAAAVQQTRWETGNVQLAARWAPRLLRDGLLRGDVQRLHTGFELLVQPLSLLVTPVAGAFAAGVALRDRRLRGAAVAVAAGQAAYVLGGLAAVGAPPQVYAALLRAPGLVVRKLTQYLRILSGRGASTWQRTERAGATSRRG